MQTASLAMNPLAPLALKAERGQWRAADIAEWPEKKAVARWLGRKFQTQALSQLYHGERATLAMCRRLRDEIDDPWAKRCLDYQIIDEQRHARVYLDYLAGIGALQPIDPVLAAAYDRALDWSGGPPGLIAAFHIILEGEALSALDTLGDGLRCPLFTRINARIRRDEARHLAFGRAYLARTLPGLALEERLEIHRWLKALWYDTAEGIFARFSFANLILRRRSRKWVAPGWQDHLRVLIELGLLGDEEIKLAAGATR